MHSRNLEQEETAKPRRSPRNLLEYIINTSINDDFFPLLVKHHKNLKTLLKCKPDHPDLKNAIFIINLNKFSSDLEKISEICAEIDMEIHKNNNSINNIRNALQDYSSKDLAREICAIYNDARNYDERFSFFQIFRINPILPSLLLFTNPFRHDPILSNEENILNLLSAFKVHDDFLINYLNTLYGDEKDGESFTGKSFELISTDYNKIKETISNISKIIPNSVPDKTAKNIEQKRRIIEKTLEKYPATLYAATKKLLVHLENSASPSLTSKLGQP